MLERLRRLVRAFVHLGEPLGDVPPDVGGPDLAPCPDTPNCVSSLADDRARYVEPFALAGEGAIDQIAAVVLQDRRAAILDQSSDYLHVAYRIPVFGWVDDVEFRVDAEAGVVHVRSASRVGHSDLGVNRRRVEELRQRITR